LSGVQPVDQRLSVFQIERVEAFGEPAIDRGEQIASLLPFALIAPQPCMLIAARSSKDIQQFSDLTHTLHNCTSSEGGPFGSDGC
jgi:hypothetical protein